MGLRLLPMGILAADNLLQLCTKYSLITPGMWFDSNEDLYPSQSPVDLEFLWWERYLHATLNQC